MTNLLIVFAGLFIGFIGVSIYFKIQEHIKVHEDV